MNNPDQNLKKVLTIPNIMSIVRLIMIPFIAIAFFAEYEGHEIVATILVAISGITDVADGKIARKFNMISDIGKILDPVADKMTQGIVLICLCYRYTWPMIALFSLYVIIEILMIYIGLVRMHKTDSVPMARWYGKLNTVVLYFVMGAFMFFPLFLEPELDKFGKLVHKLPDEIALILCIICACTITFAFIMYCFGYAKDIREHQNKNK